MGKLGPIFLQNCIFPSKNPIGQGIHSLLNIFKALIHEISEKFHKKCIKTCKFWTLCHFQLELRFFLHQSLPDNNIFSFFNICTIQSHQVFQKLDRNCIKTLNIWTFWNFCRIGSRFEAFYCRKSEFILSKGHLRPTNSFLVEGF